MQKRKHSVRSMDVSESALALAARLRQERERLGYTQNAFAELGGVKRVSQFLYEKGDRAPDTSYLLRLERHGVNIGYILFGDAVERREAGRLARVPMDEVMRIYEGVEALAQKLGTAGVDRAACQRKLFETAYYLWLTRAAVGGNPRDVPDDPLGSEAVLASLP